MGGHSPLQRRSLSTRVDNLESSYHAACALISDLSRRISERITGDVHASSLNVHAARGCAATSTIPAAIAMLFGSNMLARLAHYGAEKPGMGYKRIRRARIAGAISMPKLRRHVATKASVDQHHTQSASTIPILESLCWPCHETKRQQREPDE